LKPNPVDSRFDGGGIIVVASGPSLTTSVVQSVRFARWMQGWRVVCVNDAYRLLPHADVLYASDMRWWRTHDGAKEFRGERWTSHSHSIGYVDDKSLVASEYGLRCVGAADGAGFSSDPQCIHYGNPAHSGFQALNLALLFGAHRVILVGFDMRHVEGRAHFFGDHPTGLRTSNDAAYRDMARAYVPDDRIVNATPGSAITCYRNMQLDEAIIRWPDRSLYRDGTVAHA
jgi:hypothetical protein